jgi:hypothetical protein
LPLHQFCFENIENGKKEIKRERTTKEKRKRRKTRSRKMEKKR